MYDIMFGSTHLLRSSSVIASVSLMRAPLQDAPSSLLRFLTSYQCVPRCDTDVTQQPFLKIKFSNRSFFMLDGAPFLRAICMRQEQIKFARARRRALCAHLKRQREQLLVLDRQPLL